VVAAVVITQNGSCFLNDSGKTVFIQTPVRIYKVPMGIVALNVPEHALHFFQASLDLKLFNQAFVPNEQIVGYVL
jgi:hypothetical protein